MNRVNFKGLWLTVLLLAVLISSADAVSELDTNKLDDSPLTEMTNVTGATSPAPTNQMPTINSKAAQDAKSKSISKRVKGSEDSSLTTDCPIANCTCTEKKISCVGLNLTAIPNGLKTSSFTEFNFKNNLIWSLDFNLLPVATMESLDLSHNSIKIIVPPGLKKSSGPNPLLKLRVLNLRSNYLETLNSFFSALKLPALETLDVSLNQIREIGPSSFNNCKALQELVLKENSYLKTVHEAAFLPLTQLKKIDMSDVGPECFPLPGELFANNQKLEMVDLSGDRLIEVPSALRATSSIKTLILNNNSFRSIRQSDFINQTSIVHLEIRACSNLSKIDEFSFSAMQNLTRLNLGKNLILQSISKDAFKTDKIEPIKLELFDLSFNNISSMTNPMEFSSVTFQQILLNGNPWNCNCDLKWILQLSSLGAPIHCNTPKKFKDIEVSQYFSTIDCDSIEEESDYHALIVTGFLLFLFGLFIAIFIQKSEIYRRLFWKDQYGTIYYTKARFPPENTV